MRRLVAWFAVPAAIACSSDEETTPSTTLEDVFQSCIGSCSKQTACVPQAPVIDCFAVCGSSSAPDAGVVCDLTALKARYDQCGLLQCVNIGSCIVDLGVSCQGGGGSPGTGGGGGASGSGGAAAATGGSSGGECMACDSRATACCRALATRLGQDPAQCDDTTEAKCRAAPAAEQSSFADQCRTQLSTGASLGIAACQ